MKGLTPQSQGNTTKEPPEHLLKLPLKITHSLDGKALGMMGNVWLDAKDMKYAQ